MRHLSGTDTHMLYSDTPNAMNMIGPIGIFDPSTAPGGEVTYEQVLDYVRDRLHLSSTFRERLVRVPLGLDRPLWINDEHFDLEYHVREVALPSPGTWKQFTTQIARLGARPLDLTRPPWELYVIHGINAPGYPPGCFAMYLKLHHAAIDGVSGAELITALMQVTPDAVVEPPADEWQPEKPPSGLALLANGGFQTVFRPVRSAKTILRTVGTLPASVRLAILPPKGTPKLGSSAGTRFNHALSAHRVWDFVNFKLADVKAVKNAVPGVTVNDVAITVVSGGLRRYLDAHDELPDSPLNALMPISPRPTATQVASGAKVGAGGGGNKFIFTALPIGTDIGDPIERLEEIQRSTAHAKEYGASSKELAETAELIPGALIGTVQRAMLRVVDRVGQSAGAHVIITNVPGPRVPMYFVGAKGHALSGMAPAVDGMGLIIGVGGYVDDFSLTFTADRDMMPDPAFFAECLQTEYAALCAAVGVTPASTATEVTPVKKAKTASSAR